MRNINLSNMHISDKDGAGLGMALENNKSLRHLDMSKNDLGEKAAIALGNSLMVRQCTMGSKKGSSCDTRCSSGNGYIRCKTQASQPGEMRLCIHALATTWYLASR